MAVSPTSEQQEYVQDNETERRSTGSEVLAGPRELHLGDWMRILSLFIYLVGLVGNSLVLWLLGFRILRNPFSVSILNLAGADALHICSQFVFTCVHYFVSFLDNSFPYEIMLFLTTMSYAAGLSLRAAISTERCPPMLFPIWYQCHPPKDTSTVMCAVLWALACLHGAMDFVFCFLVYIPHNCKTILKVRFVGFLLISSVLGVSSLALLLRVQCTSRRRQPPRLHLLVLLNALVFLPCGLPKGVVGLLWRFLKVPMTHWFPFLLACVNSSANPFIYFFLGSQRHKKKGVPQGDPPEGPEG